MSGRVESDMAIKRRIDTRLKNEPILLGQYVDSMYQYSWRTKLNYVCQISRFLRWYENIKGVDVTA